MILCVYTIHVANIGNGLFVSSWNEHRIPCESFSVSCMHVTTTYSLVSFSSSQRRIRNAMRNSESFDAYR